MANYNQAISLILQNEGGYQNHPNDKGNYNSKGVNVGTKYGISARVLEQWKGYPITTNDMRNLSLTVAQEIYRKNYWQAIKGDLIKDQDIAEIIFDHAVNAGVGAATKIAQRLLNNLGANLVVDGGFGNKTLTALNALNKEDSYHFFTFYKHERIAFYSSIATGGNSSFINGWIARVQEFEKKK